MKKYFILLFIFFLNNIQSQIRSIVVLDSLTNEPIPFVTVQLSKNTGTYTNEKGVFELNENESDTLRFSHLSYDDFHIKVSNLKNSVILSPNAILLKEVKVIKGTKLSKYIDFPRKNNSFGSWPLVAKSELVTLITPNIENENSIITSLDFKFEKRAYKEFSSKLNTALRVNIYEQDNEIIKNKIYSSKVFVINSTNKDKIEVDLKDDYIALSKNGLYIGIEVIGDIDELGKIKTEKSSIRPILTDNSINDYSAKTFLRYMFNQKLFLNPMSEVMKKASPDKKIERNLSFGMTLSKKK